jgi:hypothetical protein
VQVSHRATELPISTSPHTKTRHLGRRTPFLIGLAGACNNNQKGHALVGCSYVKARHEVN